MESQIYFLVWLYCATLAEQPANRVLSEVAAIARLDIKLPVSDENGRHSVLVWLDTNYPDAYTHACKNPYREGHHEGWIFDVAIVEAELANYAKVLLL
jgi:hypothetical protein